MTELDDVKLLGGLGSILTLVSGFIPNAGFIVSILGIVLVFIAVKKIADLTEDEEIFKNYLIHVILSISSIIIIVVILFVTFIAIGGFPWISSLKTANITDFASFWSYFEGLISACAVSLIIFWVLSIVGTIYLRRSYNRIAKHTKVDLFRTTGTIYFLGAITSIILVGFILLFIGKILEVAAYFSLPDILPSEKRLDQRKCPECKRIIPEDALICPYCGKHFKSGKFTSLPKRRDYSGNW